MNDILDKLQSMEMKFASVLLEAALKLAALSDANFFILFESKIGRFYGGQDSLCDGYRNGLLSSTGNDVELEVDWTDSSLRTKRPPPRRRRPSSSRGGDDTVDVKGNLPSSSFNFLTRPSSITSPTTETPPSASAKRRKRRNGVTTVEEDAGMKRQKLVIDEDTLQKDWKQETDFSIEPQVDDGVFDGGIGFGDDVTAVDDISELPSETQSRSTRESLSEDQRLVSDWFFDEFRKNEEILDRVRRVRDWDVAKIRGMTQPESDDRRDVFGLFYDCGQLFAAKFLDHQFDFHVGNHAFQLFWSHFTNFHPHSKMRVPDKFLSSSCKERFLHPYQRGKRKARPVISSLEEELE